MCGRGALNYDWKTLWDWFDLPGAPPAGHLRRLNVAPSRRRRGEVEWTRLPVIRDQAPERRVDELAWPLVPHWLRGELPKFSTANCRSEADQPFSKTVGGKPAFRNAWKRARRCVIPMSWFYEWDKRISPSQPWRVLPLKEPLLAMAGLWDRSTTPDGAAMESFTIVTTGPNRQLAEIGHGRAPVLLDRSQVSTWLDAQPDVAESLIEPPPEDALRVEPVTRRVNNPEYHGDDLLGPAEDGES